MVKTNKPGFGEKITSFLILVFFTTIYSTLALIRLAYMWFIKGHSLFEIKPHLKPKTLDGWIHGFLDLTEIKMHYVETGDFSKPLILFVHGFPEFWYSYRHQLKFFEKDYYCVAVDLRGYGDSSRPNSVASYGVKTLVRDLIEAIEKLGRKKAIVVAHDWGALLAWNLALTQPEMVEKLIILNVPHPLAFRKQFKTGFKQLFKSWYIFLFQSPYLPELLLFSEDFKMLISMFKGSKSGLVHSENFTDDDVEAWKYTFSKVDSFKGPINYYRALMRQVDPARHDDWTVKPKTLIIWGDQDVALAVEGAIDSVNYCENAVLKRIPDSSHWVQQDVPDVVNSLIEEFLNENDSPKSNI